MLVRNSLYWFFFLTKEYINLVISWVSLIGLSEDNTDDNLNLTHISYVSHVSYAS